MAGRHLRQPVADAVVELSPHAGAEGGGRSIVRQQAHQGGHRRDLVDYTDGRRKPESFFASVLLHDFVLVHSTNRVDGKNQINYIGILLI